MSTLVAIHNSSQRRVRKIEHVSVSGANWGGYFSAPKPSIGLKWRPPQLCASAQNFTFCQRQKTSLAEQTSLRLCRNFTLASRPRRALPLSAGRLSRLGVYIITSLAMCISSREACISSSPFGRAYHHGPAVHIPSYLIPYGTVILREANADSKDPLVRGIFPIYRAQVAPTTTCARRVRAFHV